MRVSGEWMRATTTNSAVSGFTYTGICPHKRNMILGTICASYCILCYFTQSNRGYALQFWTIHRNVGHHSWFPLWTRHQPIIVIHSWIFSTINKSKKWKHTVVHLETWRLHLLRGLCVPHKCTNVLFLWSRSKPSDNTKLKI